MPTTYLASKPRYEILDGLRGVAAIIVVMFHLFETYSEGVTHQIINHGYLAVDFFFALSGFVVGYAYDDRWSQMSLWNFVKRRVIRLHPMLICGTVVGLLFFYFSGDHPDFLRIADVPWWLTGLVCLLCCTMYPMPQSLDIRGWGEFNPLNGATWSLQWEYLANLLYATVIRRFSNGLLAMFVVLSAGLTIVLCFNIDVLGVLSAREGAAYTVIGGWSLTPDQLQIGLTRLLYPFFCGLLLARLYGKFDGRGGCFSFQHSAFNMKGGFWWCSLIIALILAMPRVGGSNPDNYWMNGLYESICIIAVFPLIVLAGASSTVSGRRSIKVCKWLGDISYPLYVTHYPIVYVQMSWMATHPDMPVATHAFVAVCCFILAIGIAYASLKLYDEPVREWLKKKLFRTK